MRYKLRVTREESEAVQTACFKMGIHWLKNKNTLMYLDKPFLFIEDDSLSYMDELDWPCFEKHKNELIDPADFIKLCNNTPSKFHVHAEKMSLYAVDAFTTEEPWKLWECSISPGEWRPLTSHPDWNPCTSFRRKAHEIIVGKHKFPRPIMDPPEPEAPCWRVSFVKGKFGAEGIVWKHDDFCFNSLKANILHLSRKDAETHASVLNAINSGDV